MEEIKRKFLVKSEPGSSKCLKTVYIEQGYISEELDIRVRMETNAYSKRKYATEYMMVIKGKGDIKRYSEKINIKITAYLELCNNIKGKQIKKLRKFYDIGNEKTAELDVYQNISELVTVEVKFKTEEDANIFIPPNWFGKEITHDLQYKNLERKQQ